MSSIGVLKIALLAGGTSSEREVSLKGAEVVKKALEKLGHKYEFFDPAQDLPKLAQRAKEFDCAFLVVHGPGGEDGTLQGFLDSIGLPYQGAGVLGSALAMHKGISKSLYKLAGLNVPEGKTFSKDSSFEIIKTYGEKIGFPLVVKPATQGSSIGLSVVKDKKDLKKAVEAAFNVDREIILEKYLKGKEITVGILDDKPLPVVEIVPKVSEIFDYETKYTPGLSEEICPARLSERLTKKAQEYGLIAHKTLKLRHYSRTDMIIVEDEIYVLETNTIPGMTETSLLPLAAKVAGYSFPALIQKLLELTLRDKNT
ncbi:D-alanine--D-alanine ligase [Thermodesulfobacterium geofontis OPF15]|jgi:D-alanine-D-alanine ligase|uniref:D-alanine--D-alanine ligase n=1 Tax=Thermodesulfobacterium geofontis (strain OPF15) TaxID=795359 RepID=F8C5X5_THEGP|nr:D-alanine--D-alanine ligase [Thermodesulfobacterium geofontis]AEH23116.1 D-alanine--D-alanine ligase [Thermodesulfobacterium geofontis OPF15]